MKHDKRSMVNMTVYHRSREAIYGKQFMQRKHTSKTACPKIWNVQQVTCDSSTTCIDPLSKHRPTLPNATRSYLNFRNFAMLRRLKCPNLRSSQQHIYTCRSYGYLRDIDLQRWKEVEIAERATLDTEGVKS